MEYGLYFYHFFILNNFYYCDFISDFTFKLVKHQNLKQMMIIIFFETNPK